MCYLDDNCCIFTNFFQAKENFKTEMLYWITRIHCFLSFRVSFHQLSSNIIVGNRFKFTVTHTFCSTKWFCQTYSANELTFHLLLKVQRTCFLVKQTASRHNPMSLLAAFGSVCQGNLHSKSWACAQNHLIYIA